MCVSGPSAPPPPPPPTKLKELPHGGQLAVKKRKAATRSLKIERTPGAGIQTDEAPGVVNVTG